jgi:hypothetical protein
MKLFSIVLVSAFCSLISLSQEIDSRLLSRYAPEQLTEMYNNNNQEYQFLVYALDNAVYLTDTPEGKTTANFESIDLLNRNFDFVSLGLLIKDENQYFKIAGEDKLLVVKSRLVLNYEMQNK